MKKATAPKDAGLPDVVTFLASLADNASAISLPGQSDGMTIKLEVPESEIANALLIVRLRGKIVKVCISEA